MTARLGRAIADEYSVRNLRQRCARVLADDFEELLEQGTLWTLSIEVWAELLNQTEAELRKLASELSKLMAGQELEPTKKAAEFAVKVCEDIINRKVRDRPERLNSLTFPLLGQLRQTFIDARADRSVRCVVITGAGRGFCAGMDISGGANPDKVEPTYIFKKFK